MHSDLTYEQVKALREFAEDKTEECDLEAAISLSRLNDAVQRRIISRLSKEQKKNERLKQKIREYSESNAELKASLEPRETNLDSADVARALLYQLQQLKTWKLSDYKVNTILYAMYASWLNSKNARLFDEHPVATPYGPRFWHALNRTNSRIKVSDSEWKAFAEKYTDIAAFCKNAARKYYDIDEKILAEKFKRSDPYRNAGPEFNNGKWNKTMDDKAIAAWRKNNEE